VGPHPGPHYFFLNGIFKSRQKRDNNTLIKDPKHGHFRCIFVLGGLPSGIFSPPCTTPAKFGETVLVILLTRPSRDFTQLCVIGKAWIFDLRLFSLPPHQPLAINISVTQAILTPPFDLEFNRPAIPLNGFKIRGEGRTSSRKGISMMRTRMGRSKNGKGWGEWIVEGRVGGTG